MAVSSERVTVTDTATALIGAESDTVSGGQILVRNRSATDSVDLGDSSVTSTGGYELAAGNTVELRLSAGDRLYGIAAAAGSVRVDVLRVG